MCLSSLCRAAVVGSVKPFIDEQGEAGSRNQDFSYQLQEYGPSSSRQLDSRKVFGVS